ncbi:MAG: cupin domain-containing protein [Pseudomonadota bacterium]
MPATTARTRLVARLIALACIAFLGFAPASFALEPYKKIVEIFEGNTTIAGEPLVFPSEEPGVKAIVVTLLPGERTAWHRHGTPLFGYVLEGALTVDYEGIGVKHFTAGSGFLEAMHVTHQGGNEGTVPARVLAVFFTGAEAEATITVDPPD